MLIFQSKFIYYPYREVSMTPVDIRLQYQDVYIETEDNVKLNGWFIPSENTDIVILFFHGNGGNISHRLESIQLFHKMGFSVFIFDYRGYGLSEGTLSEEGTYKDAKAALDYLIDENNISLENIVYFGRSLGASIASWLAVKNSPKVLILESTFTSIEDLASQLYPFLPVRLLARYHYNTKKNLERISCPVLIIHSPDDEMIPYSHGVDLYNTANEPKELFQLQGLHNDGFMLTGFPYIEKIKNFILR